MLTRFNRPTATESDVLVAVKTPLMPKPATIKVPSHFTVRESVKRLQEEPPRDAQAGRVVQQLHRETSAIHHYLAVRPSGLEQIDPGTTVAEIAIPREIRTSEGKVERIGVAAVEVQSYSKVGDDRE